MCEGWLGKVVQSGRSACVCVAKKGSRGSGKKAGCCLVWKTKMGIEDKNVECSDLFFNA